MRNPFELLGDFYDYHLQYYRWFLHRRLLFSDINAETLKKEFKFNIFENKDHENVGSLVKQSSLIGLSLGIGLAPFKYVSLTDFQKKSPRRALPAALGVVALCTGAGLAYGSVVNATANFRGQKNDEVNHALAALVTFPVMGVYAKTNKVQWGLMNAVLGAVFVSYMKYVYSGKFYGVDPAKQSSRIRVSDSPNNYRV